jgi:transposase-like protein
LDITAFVGKLLEQDDVDALREGIRVLAQAVMETEVSAQIGAAPYERSTERVAYRNGYRTRRWDTRVGTIELRIPKVTAGAYFPSLLEPRRRAERALHAVVVEAYVKGVSTRKVDDLVRALGIDGISRSEVSRICKSLDEEVRGFLGRQIETLCPYLWLDATFHKVREAGRVVSVATVVAVGVTEQGDRTVLGAATGPSEDHQFWTSFLRQLVKRGLKGVRLVISDAHEGLRQAIAKVLHGSAWQRSSVNMSRGGAVPLVISAAGMRTLAA